MADYAPFLQNYLDSLHQKYAELRDGAVANYIPELAKAEPEDFAIALVTVDGHVYQVGESRTPFTVQSISKPFTYGLALQDLGVEAVRAKVNVEPSGEAFNQISLEPGTGRPRNPLINAGAIATAGLVHGDGSQQKMARILDVYGRYTGSPLIINDAVYRSEKSTGHRNRAIAHLLLNAGIIEGDPEDTLDTYFRQCSVEVNCRDLAMMGATLGNLGVNPVTGVRALPAELVPRVLSVMATCGMYDASGEWLYEIGMPAKSGVGGGLIAVLPGKLGLAVYSPRLDARGNTVRGIAVCRSVSTDLRLHSFYQERFSSGNVIRSSYDAVHVRSKRKRDPQATALLGRRGGEIRVFELTGELMFATAEIVASQIGRESAGAQYLIVDLQRVASSDTAAAQLLVWLQRSLREQGKTLLLTGTADKYGLVRYIKQHARPAEDEPLLRFEVRDDALTWCEEALLTAEGISTVVGAERPLADQPLCQNLSPAEIAELETRLIVKRFDAGAFVCREGDEDNSLYFLLAGEVGIYLSVGNDQRHCIAKIAAGGSAPSGSRGCWRSGPDPPT